MSKEKFWNSVTQIALPGLTITAQIAIALKYPELGLLINMAAQPFWLFAGWKAYKQAGQSGIFITALIFTFVTAAGIANYWIL